ncbi:MAG: hypothetical protein QM777_13110 [Pseudorhodoferax sp.]
MKKIVAIVLSCLAFSAVAQDWVQVSGTDQFKDEVQKDSLQITTNRSGEEISAYTSRRVYKGGGRIEFSRWYVSIKDCGRGRGILTNLSINNVFQYDVEWEENSGKVSERLAMVSCAYAADIIRTKNDKSLDNPTQVQPGAQWTTVSETEMTLDHLQNGSLSFARTRGGDIVNYVVGRRQLKKTGKVEYQIWYVKATDCAKNSGYLTTLDQKGQYQYDNDFLQGGGTVASSIAEVICGAALEEAHENAKKQRQATEKQIAL